MAMLQMQSLCARWPVKPIERTVAFTNRKLAHAGMLRCVPLVATLVLLAALAFAAHRVAMIYKILTRIPLLRARVVEFVPQVSMHSLVRHAYARCV